MKSEEKLTPNHLKATGVQPEGVQDDSATPIPQKPSFLFLVSTLIGVITLVVLAISGYHGITQ